MQALELVIAELAQPATLAASLRESARRASHGARPANQWEENLRCGTTSLMDLKYGARVLMRSRGFAMAAVLTLAIGIGATTAIFSVVNAVLLRPVPFTDIDRLAMVWETDRNTGTNREPASLPDVIDMRERSRQVASFAAFAAAERTITPIEGDPTRVPVLFATHEFLPLLGIRPVTGSHVHAAPKTCRADRTSRSSAIGCGSASSSALRTSLVERSG